MEKSRLKFCPFCCDAEPIDEKRHEALYEDSTWLLYLTLGHLRVKAQVYTGAANGNTETYRHDLAISYCPVCGRSLITIPASVPLSLEQLEQMDGEPVWLETAGVKQWAFLSAPRAGITNSFAFTGPNLAVLRFKEDYGADWICYATKPAGQEG